MADGSDMPAEGRQRRDELGPAGTGSGGVWVHSVEPNGLATGAGRAGSGWLWGAREGSDKTSKDGGSPMNKHAEIHAAWPVVCSYLDVNLTRRPAHVWRARANAPHPSRPPTAPPPNEKHDPNVQNPGQRQDAIAAHGRRGCSARKRSPATTGPTRGLARAAVAVAARAPEAGPPGPRSPSAPRYRTSPVDLRLRFRASSRNHRLRNRRGPQPR